MRMFHLAIKQFEGFVEWLNEIYALISVCIYLINSSVNEIYALISVRISC